MSRQSKGCLKCKARKLKCDEGKPVCQRCIKIGYEEHCTYADPSQLVVRDQTQHAAHRAQLKWRQRATKNVDAVPDINPFHDYQAPAQNIPSPSLSADSATSEDPAIERFFYDWVVQDEPYSVPAPRGNTFLDFLPEMYEKAPSDGPLVAAVSALAHANSARRFCSPESEEIAIKNYDRSLMLLKQAMANPAAAHTDHTLAAITLLAFYELLMSPHITAKGSFAAHVGGMISLFNFKVFKQAHPATAVGQIILVYAQMLVHGITRGRHPSLPLETRNILPVKFDASYDQWELFYRAGELCGDINYTIKQCLQNNHDSFAQLSQLLRRTQTLDKQFEDWARSLSVEWSCTLVPFNSKTIPTWLSPLLESSWTPRHIYRYSSLMISSRWRMYWTFRLIMNQVLLQASSFLKVRNVGSTTFGPDSINEHEIQFKICDIVDAICGQSIGTFDDPLLNKPEAKTMGEVCTVRGYYVIFPLPACYCCLRQAPITDFDAAGRLEWITKTLRLVRDGLGFAKACAFMELQEGNALSIQLWDYENNPG